MQKRRRYFSPGKLKQTLMRIHQERPEFENLALNPTSVFTTCVFSFVMANRVFFFSCFVFTHRATLAIVVAWVWIEGTQLHPAKTHFILSFIKEPTYVCPGLKEDRRKMSHGGMCVCLSTRRTEAERRNSSLQVLLQRVPFYHRNWGHAAFVASVVFLMCPCARKTLQECVVLYIWPCGWGHI